MCMYIYKHSSCNRVIEPAIAIFVLIKQIPSLDLHEITTQFNLVIAI